MKNFFAALFILGAVLFFAPQLMAKETAKDDDNGVVHLIEVKGVISPATRALIKSAIARAENADARALIIAMHTPGGLYDSTQEIIQDILASNVPVATYVSPSGSHAASAGTYILYASHIAAMSPSTNLGAATPIQLQGGNDNGGGDDGDAKDGKDKPKKKNMSTLEHKMVNDAAAYIRGLAELRGRNMEWAEEAVRDAVSLSASEAMSKKVIDIIADNAEQLLEKMHGKTVKMAEGKTQKLDTKGAKIEKFEPGWQHDILEIITHPNIALLLMSIGTYGLIYEFANPGALFPGIIGTICLLIGLYAMNVLPVNYSGLALIILGVALMAAEAFTPSFGILGLGGAGAFIFGSMMLIQSDIPELQVDWWMIALMTGISLGAMTFILGMIVKSRGKPSVTGNDELLSAVATINEWAGSKGEVFVTGESWQAFSSEPFILQKGDKVKVVSVDGLRLEISPLPSNG